MSSPGFQKLEKILSLNDVSATLQMHYNGTSSTIKDIVRSLPFAEIVFDEMVRATLILVN